MQTKNISNIGEIWYHNCDVNRKEEYDMSTLKALAQKYANQLLRTTSINRYAVADEIVRDIENLVYSGTKEKISYEDKEKLLELINDIIDESQNDKFELIILEKSDNKNFLTLINYINSKLTRR